MAKYRSSTGGIVEAIQFNGDPETLMVIMGMIKASMLDGQVEFNFGDYVVSDSTLDGAVSVYSMGSEEFNEEFTLVLEGAMSVVDQLNAFEDELWRLIDRFVDEFDLPLFGAVGVLEVVKNDMVTGGLDKS